jgi:hypothetical protein
MGSRELRDPGSSLKTRLSEGRTAGVQCDLAALKSHTKLDDLDP